MGTASIHRHFYGLQLPLDVIVRLQNNNIPRRTLAHATVSQLTQIGLSEAEATRAISMARKTLGIIS